MADPRPLTVPEQRALEVLDAAGGRWAHPVELFGDLPPYAALQHLRRTGRAARYGGQYAITDQGRAYLATLHR